jgi:hypothetical protein
MAINPALAGRSGAGSNPFATQRVAVTVMGVESESSRVMVRDSFGNEFIVDGSMRPKAMGMPVPEERWIIAKIGGRWTLELQVGAAPSPTCTRWPSRC